MAESAMHDEEAWALEERFWLGGAAVFEQMLDNGCVMAFPGMGVIRRAEILKGLAGAPRWLSVGMSERVIGRAGSVIVLGYRAEARRKDQPVYRCLCTSTYRMDGAAWRLVQHQQTPVE